MSSNAASLLLAIETSARVGSVAIRRAGEPAIVRRLTGDRRHTVELMPAIQGLLGEHGARLADVDVLAWSCGPGSFTGLRIGATVARMAASAAGCRVVNVPTLDAIARNWEQGAGSREQEMGDGEQGSGSREPGARYPRVVVMLDAQTERVYAAVYECQDNSPPRRLAEPAVFDDVGKLLSDIDPPFLILGEGVRRHRATCEASPGTIAPEAMWPPSAGAVAEIGWEMAEQGRFAEAQRIVPLYLRPPACEEVYEKRRAAARARRGE